MSVPILNGTNSKSSTSNNNTNTGNNTNRLIIINDMNTFSLRDIQVKCLIAYNTLMNKSHRNYCFIHSFLKFNFEIKKI